MFDEQSEGFGVFLFDEFADHLLEQGVDASPSRVHGCLSGLLAAGAPRQSEYGLDALGQALDLALHGELAGRVLELYAATAAAMDDEEFGFHPLLPDDDTDIRERTAAMADWCSGFLAGFALVSAAADRSGEALSQDSGEILRDIAAIAEAEVDEDADEDDSEESYAELVEYLRFAVLNVVMDCRPDQS
ncbi:MAG: UPF0149 family protein [Halioglobus sp.]